MKRVLLSLLSVAFLWLAPTLPLMTSEARAEEAAKKELTSFDRDFIREAAETGITEVKFGELAAEKGKSEAVRKLGRDLAEYRKKVNAEVRALAGKNKVSIPDKLNEDEAEDYKKLSELKGDAFDKAYIQAAIDTNVDAVERFEYATETVTDPEVKEFAKKALPRLLSHLKEIRGVKHEMDRGIKITP